MNKENKPPTLHDQPRQIISECDVCKFRDVCPVINATLQIAGADNSCRRIIDLERY